MAIRQRREKSGRIKARGQEREAGQRFGEGEAGGVFVEVGGRPVGVAKLEHIRHDTPTCNVDLPYLELIHGGQNVWKVNTSLRRRRSGEPCGSWHSRVYNGLC